ncbi:MAG: ABC transporter permease [Thermosynechococcaceae cyanobacterium MS004]|nr:ABC transporter permease [Thermosynechococcaceae cyanobacterium MS004]
MTWWQRLQKNPLARFGITILVIFYIAVIGADFFAPYDPYVSQVDGSLLPPTKVYWQNDQGQWTGPVVYPTTQGAVNPETGNRLIKEDRTQPSPVRLFVKGAAYSFLQIRLPLPTQLSMSNPKIDQVVVFPGFKADRHLFGAEGAGKINILGTDEAARDQFSRILFGGRISLSIGLLGVVISFPLGMLVGGISGYFGGMTDGILMRMVEVLMTIPSIYLIVALAKVLPDTLSSSDRFILIVFITSFVAWAGLARVIRGEVLSIKQREFVQAARAMGAQPLYIIIRHILPQTATYMIIAATLSIPGFIGAESVLSLIGLGIQQPDPSWGNLLSLATNASILVFQPWLIWPPAILLVLTVLAFNLLGDALRDVLDPRSVRR